MTIDLPDALELRLAEIAKGQSLSTPELVERVLAQYAAGVDVESVAWVTATQNSLSKVWPQEDFSAWNPPHGTQAK